MAKNEVYSWRLSAETKSALEETARRNRSSVAELLDQIVDDWLAQQRQLNDEETEQQRLHKAALQVTGTIQGDNPDRGANAKALLRARLAKRHAS